VSGFTPVITIRGGNGGGVLRLIATTISIAGQVTARGEDGLPMAGIAFFGGSAPSGCPGYSGAGSGGGILLAARSVTVTGAVLAPGGVSPNANYPTTGDGGLGRVKILAASSTLTGTLTGAVVSTLLPPLAVTSATYPDPGLAYNDNGVPLQLSWERAFPAVQGYYVRLDAAGSGPPTPGNGQFITTEARSYPITALASGDNFFHIVPVDAQSNVGVLETVFKIHVNNAAPPVTSSSHPSQTTWSSNTSPSFTWTFPQGDASASGARYVFDQDGLTVPGASATFIPVTQKQILLPNVPPGLRVFHILSVDTRGYPTQAVSHYRVKIGADPGSGSIVGAVVDGGGAPIAGASLSVNNGLFTQASNSAGQYNFGATIPAGSWQLRATIGGRTAVKTVAVTS
jgi:hypothetical protein